MCGIVAYVGEREAQPILLDALSRLEYRGYDSAGVALLNGHGIDVKKRAGRISGLVDLCSQSPNAARNGISHTRWATHGEANDTNAHPHKDASGKIALVHNGVIENFTELKHQLEAKGHTFLSATDSEVIAHVMGDAYEEAKGEGRERLEAAFRLGLSRLKGTYGLALIHADFPDLILGARRGSPLVLGLGEKENFLSSDANALVGYSNRVVYLKDNDIVTVTNHDFSITSSSTKTGSYEIQDIETSPEEADLGDYPHYMLKEIFEQPHTIENAMRGRLNKEDFSAHLGGLNLPPEKLRDIERIVVLACGTALHAGMIGKHIIESLAHLPVDTEYASEFRYRNAPLFGSTMFFTVSQSGETADTLAALREAHRKGYQCLGICNNVGSTIARESDGGVYMHAGPEIGVAATKSFTSQVTIFALLGLLLGRMRYVSPTQGAEIIQALEALPSQVKAILQKSEAIKTVAQKYKDSHSMLFLGRQYHFPVALEGALKMKEISYIHAEGYPSAELKHGVIALIDEQTPSVFLAPKDGLYEKNMNSIQEVKARRGPVIAVTTEDNEKLSEHVDDVITVPKTLECLQPILSTIPLQLLSYHTAVALGRDVDKPRNLAKSVTVE